MFAYTQIIAVTIPIFITLGAFLLIFGLNYIRYKDRQAMIEKGLDPGPYGRKIEQVPGSRSLAITISMTFMGLGLGLLISFWATQLTFFKGEEEPVYFGFISILGGLGLFLSEILQKRFSRNNSDPTLKS